MNDKILKSALQLHDYLMTAWRLLEENFLIAFFTLWLTDYQRLHYIAQMVTNSLSHFNNMYSRFPPLTLYELHKHTSIM